MCLKQKSFKQMRHQSERLYVCVVVGVYIFASKCDDETEK